MAFPRLFRIFYSIAFTIGNLILLLLLLITPGDSIVQALSNKQLYNVFVIAGCYLVTLVLVVIIYASRLYTNRTVLAAIPKTWIPVEKGDVGKRVRKVIVENLSRSAVIAWNARPRVSNHTNAGNAIVDTQGGNLRRIETTGILGKYFGFLNKKQTDSEKVDQGILIPPHPPVWGEIAHDGWSPPTSPDLPSLQFVTVVLELPHLIEAKAVSLAPPNPSSTTSPPMPDLRAVELLQRPAAMGLRDYITYLTSLGILAPTSSVMTFLSTYETARFSTRPRTELEFRELMRLFAEVLRNMTPLDPTVLDYLDGDNEDEEESDIDADASSSTTSEASPALRSRSRSHASSSNVSSRSSSHGTIRSASSRARHQRSGGTDREKVTINTRSMSRSTGGAALATAPTTPKSMKHSPSHSRFADRSSSMNSFAQSRRPYTISQASSGSLRSLSGQSAASGTAPSGSEGSVIRLSRSDEGHELPYVLQLDT